MRTAGDNACIKALCSRDKTLHKGFKHQQKAHLLFHAAMATSASAAVNRRQLVVANTNELADVLVALLNVNVSSRSKQRQLADAVRNGFTVEQALQEFALSTSDLAAALQTLDVGSVDHLLGLPSQPLPTANAIPDLAFWDDVAEEVFDYAGHEQALSANSFRDAYAYTDGSGLSHEYELLQAPPARNAPNADNFDYTLLEHANGDEVVTSDGVRVGQSELYSITVSVPQLVPVMAVSSGSAFAVNEWDVTGAGGRVFQSSASGDVVQMIADEVFRVYERLKPFTASRPVVVTAQCSMMTTTDAVLNAYEIRGELANTTVNAHLVQDQTVEQAIRNAVSDTLLGRLTYVSSQSTEFTDLTVSVQVSGMTTGNGIDWNSVSSVKVFRKWFGYFLTKDVRRTFIPVNGVTTADCFYHSLIPSLKDEIVATGCLNMRGLHTYIARTRDVGRFIALLTNTDLDSSVFTEHGLDGFFTPNKQLPSTVVSQCEQTCFQVFTEGVKLSAYKRHRSCPTFYDLVTIVYELKRSIYTFNLERVCLHSRLCLTIEEFNDAYDELTVESDEVPVTVFELVEKILENRGPNNVVRTKAVDGILTWPEQGHAPTRETSQSHWSRTYELTRLPEERGDVDPIVLGYLHEMNHIVALTTSVSVSNWAAVHNLTGLNTALLCNQMAFVTDSVMEGVAKKRSAKRVHVDSYETMRATTSLCFKCGHFTYGKSHRCRTTFCKSCLKVLKASTFGGHQHLAFVDQMEGRTILCKLCDNNVPRSCEANHKRFCTGRIKKCPSCNHQVRVMGEGSISLEEHQTSGCAVFNVVRCKRCKVCHVEGESCLLGPQDAKADSIHNVKRYVYDVETFMKSTREDPIDVLHFDLDSVDDRMDVGNDEEGEQDESVMATASWDADKQQRFNHIVNAVCVLEMPDILPYTKWERKKSRIGGRGVPTPSLIALEDVNKEEWSHAKRDFMSGKTLMDLAQYECAERYANIDACKQEGVAYDFDTLAEFFEFFINLDHDAIFFAHNGAKYDCRFILDYCYQSGVAYPVQIVGTGTSITILTFEFDREEELVNGATKNRKVRVTFKDSCKFFPVSLRNLPKTVGCTRTEQLNLVKDHFPHAFHTQSNQYYVGPLPAREFWGNLSDSEWSQLKETYPVGTLYDLRAELIKYCYQDCKTLAFALEYFELEFISLCAIDPLINASTAASLAMKTFRSTFVKDNMLFTLPKEFVKNARDAYKGARTEVFVNMWNAAGNAMFIDKLRDIGLDSSMLEQLKRTSSAPSLGSCAAYFDVTSLYPYVMNDCVMLGTKLPVRVKGTDLSPDWLTHEGIVVCIISTPIDAPDDFVPVIPSRDACEDNPRSYKLRFRHMLLERVTITMVDLRLALAAGYVLEEVVEFDDYGIGVPGESIFGEYIKTFLKIKTESGNALSLEEAVETCTAFKARFGLDLSMDELQAPKNEGRKAVAKLLMNCLYGKLGESVKSRKQIMTVEEFEANVLQAVLSGGDQSDLKLRGWEVLNNGEPCYDGKHRLLVSLYDSEDDSLRLRTNVAVAAYITSHARRVLIEMIQTLNEMDGFKVMYCDTDSVIFTGPSHILMSDRTKHMNQLFMRHFKGKKLPPHLTFGSMLGQWEDEHKENERLVELVALLPKTYSCLIETQSITGDVSLKYQVKSKGVKVLTSSDAFTRGTALVSKAGDFSRQLLDHADWHAAYKALALAPKSFMLEQRYNIVFVKGKNGSSVDTVRGSRVVTMRYNEKRELADTDAFDINGNIATPASLFLCTNSLDASNSGVPFEEANPGLALSFQGLKELAVLHAPMQRVLNTIEAQFREEDQEEC